MRIIIKPLGTLLFGSVIGFIAVIALLNKESLSQVISHESIAAKVHRESAAVLLKCPDCGAEISASVPELADMVLPKEWQGDRNIRSYPAEEATVTGAEIYTSGSLPGYLGAGVVVFRHAEGDRLEWHIAVRKAGTYRLAFRYANPHGKESTLRVVSRAGQEKELEITHALAFPRTGDKRNWEYVSVDASLVTGANTIRIGTTGSGGPILDGLVVVPLNTPHDTPAVK